MTSLHTDFEVLAFFTADHAVVEAGKLYVNGGLWDKIAGASYPFAVPPLSLVAGIKVPSRAYHQDHSFEMGLEDADGQSLGFRAEGRFRVGTDPDMRTGDPTTMTFALPVYGVVLPHPGDYSFTLKVDGSPVARYSIRATEPPMSLMLKEGPFQHPSGPIDG